MKRFLSVSFVLWAALLLYSNTANALYYAPANANSMSMFQDRWVSSQQEACDILAATNPSKFDSCSYASTGTFSVYLNGTNYLNRPGVRVTALMVGVTNPTANLRDMGSIEPCPAGEELQNGYCVVPVPECNAPDYLVGNECVTAEPICYTDIESMSEECLYVGDPSLTPEVPEGCVLDPDTGKEFCLSEDPACTIVNGFEYCPNPNEVCGIKNGAYSCADPATDGCGLFNGEKICFTENGDKVTDDSPDHPDNGGNLDGNPENDIMDSRDPVDGGDPTNQPDSAPATDDANRASEDTARKSLGELRKLNSELRRNTSEIITGFDSMSEEAPADGDNFTEPDTQALDDHQASIGTDDMDDNLADGVGNTVTGLIPQGTCGDLGFQFNGFNFSLPCDKTQKIRDILSWALYVLTVWFLFDVITTPHTRKM